MDTSNTIATIAWAAWRRSSSSTSMLHSERIAAGTCGSRPPPATAARRTSDADGAPRSAANTSAVTASVVADGDRPQHARLAVPVHQVRP